MVNHYDTLPSGCEYREKEEVCSGLGQAKCREDSVYTLGVGDLHSTWTSTELTWTWGWALLMPLPASPQFLHLLNRRINPALLRGICEALMRQWI